MFIMSSPPLSQLNGQYPGSFSGYSPRPAVRLNQFPYMQRVVRVGFSRAESPCVYLIGFDQERVLVKEVRSVGPGYTDLHTYPAAC